MHLPILRPGGIPILLFLVFTCATVVVRTATTKSAPPSGTKKVDPGKKTCSEAIVRIIGKGGISGDGRFLKEAKSVHVTISVNGLAAKQEFTFHIHEGPAGNNNDCSTTLGHYDTSKPPRQLCAGKNPKDCQLGDLAGKSKPLSDRRTGAASISYRDPVLDTSDLPGRSVVVHAPNSLEKIACGTITCKRK
ncbi:copper/zinc superoxide dismutase [Puccinia triticina 1-1 BBBD Race 1]|uniref:Copper/zinc superoxide dismutase n=2 Tax=Puccinia triticina TaxID=208348 RepID=A0A180GLH6_PUCT1|nr:uncharacterized protein PtA15_3A563 [Puccinia triticina]OAV93485.1 copper/zinc superoxide dismutase [Puccinia triticina 1-1 BBBD Race 1]WAQ83194.1 hypothetical protein PtA15_3A563 [Puccinia triticina]WAR54040.1 hypothetical protein PtB15_3B550 [Puccinia triticina]